MTSVDRKLRLEDISPVLSSARILQPEAQKNSKRLESVQKRILAVALDNFHHLIVVVIAHLKHLHLGESDNAEVPVESIDRVLVVLRFDCWNLQTVIDHDLFVEHVELEIKITGGCLVRVIDADIDSDVPQEFLQLIDVLRFMTIRGESILPFVRTLVFVEFRGLHGDETEAFVGQVCNDHLDASANPQTIIIGVVFEFCSILCSQLCNAFKNNMAPFFLLRCVA